MQTHDMNRSFFQWLLLLVSAAGFTGCRSLHPTVSGIPNFGIVNQGARIYRGAQPESRAGWDYLRSLGVRTVLKLNTEAEGSDSVSGMRVIALPITSKEQRSIVPRRRLESAVKALAAGGVFVHCGSQSRSRRSALHGLVDARGGQDRTGLVVAAYRTRVEHWPKAVAEAEMKSYRFHGWLLKGLQTAWEEWSRECP